MLNELDAKRQRPGDRQRTKNLLGETVELVSKEIRATRELLSQKPPLEKASVEFLNEFDDMDLDDQVLILEDFETELTARTFLITLGALRKRLIDRTLAKMKKKEDVEG